MTETINPIIGYIKGRSGSSNNIHVLVTVEIPRDANTDLNRDDIFDPLNASYKTNIIKILKIIDENLNEYSICTIDYDNENKIGDILHEEDDYYIFYLSKKRAIYSMHSYNYVGYTISYYDNGQKEEEYTLTEKRKKHGNYKCWTYDGKLLIDCNYSHGYLHGEYKEWDVKQEDQEDHEDQEDKEDEEDEEDKEDKVDKIDNNTSGLKLISHVLYSNGNKVEYLDLELAIKKIDNIYNKKIEYIDKELIGFNPAMKFKKLVKNTVQIDKFKILIKEIFDTIKKLNIIKSKNNEVIMYNNLKKMDLIKKLYNIFNTEYGKSYTSLYPNIKANAKEQIENFITQFDNKPEQIYQEFKAYLITTKQTLFM